MKKIVFLFLCVCILGLSSCLKKKDNIGRYTDLPAIFGYTSSFQPVITVFGESFLAPDLSTDYDLNEDDAILTSFEINFDNQPSNLYLTTSELTYTKVEKSRAFSGGETGSSEFSAPIEGVEPYGQASNVIFIYMKHTAPSDQVFEYEMVYNYDSSTPTVYIRAKKVGEGSEPEETIRSLHAFDMRDFFATLPKNSEDNRVTFNIKYKTGSNADDSDRYANWSNNPLVTVVE